MLAPMEGVTDFHMRRILTSVYAYDRCVTEFIRITNNLYPDRVFLKCCPELETGGMTDTGVPVYAQLLGTDHHYITLNAQRLVELGAPGIDLNFGCPAKTVNRHGGGSSLLRTPDRVISIVDAVRNSVDPSIPVTAKIRLGFDNSDNLMQIATGIEAAGATELCVHARTRLDGYKPPAHWSEVKQVRDALSIPVTVNGEIWNDRDASMAQSDSECFDLMLGRGALAMPDLARQIRSDVNSTTCTKLVWLDVLELLEQLLQTAVDLPARYAGNRTKQWLCYLIREYAGARELFPRIKRLRDIDTMAEQIRLQRKLCIAGDVPGQADTVKEVEAVERIDAAQVMLSV